MDKIRCVGCYSEKFIEELDTDRYCWDCIDGWPDPKIMAENMAELLTGTVQKLAEAKGQTVDQVKTQLITDSYGKPASGRRSTN